MWTVTTEIARREYQITDIQVQMMSVFVIAPNPHHTVTVVWGWHTCSRHNCWNVRVAWASPTVGPQPSHKTINTYLTCIAVSFSRMNHTHIEDTRIWPFPAATQAFLSWSFLSGAWSVFDECGCLSHTTCMFMSWLGTISHLSHWRRCGIMALSVTYTIPLLRLQHDFWTHPTCSDAIAKQPAAVA